MDTNADALHRPFMMSRRYDDKSEASECFHSFAITPPSQDNEDCLDTLLLGQDCGKED